VAGKESPVATRWIKKAVGFSHSGPTDQRPHDALWCEYLPKALSVFERSHHLTETFETLLD
jgi:hypothetical protein